MRRLLQLGCQYSGQILSYQKMIGQLTDAGLYWRERQREVDFVLRHGDHLAAFEVKSGARRESTPGLESFAQAWNPRQRILVGTGGLPLEEFLATPVAEWSR